MLGILGSILFLKDIYRTYGELTLGDILTFLIIALTGPITLLALLTKYLDRFKILNMKKITCIQQYVIDNLIEDEILSTNSLLSAVSKVCSEEQFNNILAILIETPIPCTDIPKLERKEDSGNKTNLGRKRSMACKMQVY